MSDIYQIFLENEIAIKRIIARNINRLDEVDDLAQEVFVRCFAAEMTSDIKSPKAFLLRSAKNLAISHRKKKINTTSDSVENFGGSDVFMDDARLHSEEQLAAKRKLAALAEAMASLPAAHRKALWMRRIEGLKLSQIATRLDISISTAKKHVSDAILSCEKHLQRAGYESEDLVEAPRHANTQVTPSKVVHFASTGITRGADDGW